MDARLEAARELRVLLVEPHPGLRESLVDLLACRGLPFQVTGDRAGALVAVREWRPTVAVLEPYRWDDQGDPGDGLLDVLHAVADVRAVDARLPIVVHTAMFPPGMSPRLASFGVAALIVKGSPPEELLTAVYRAHAVGRGWLPVGVAR